MVFRLALYALLLLAAPSTAGAQLTMRAIRDLNFGSVIPGVQTSIPPNHPLRSGEWEFISAIGRTVSISFNLPNRLNGPAGRTMIIRFGPNDGIATGTAPTSVPVTFDPRRTNNFNLVSSARILVFLGGRVQPAGNQQPGTYRNTVTMTVTVF